MDLENKSILNPLLINRNFVNESELNNQYLCFPLKDKRWSNRDFKDDKIYKICLYREKTNELLMVKATALLSLILLGNVSSVKFLIEKGMSLFQSQYQYAKDGESIYFHLYKGERIRCLIRKSTGLNCMSAAIYSGSIPMMELIFENVKKYSYFDSSCSNAIASLPEESAKLFIKKFPDLVKKVRFRDVLLESSIAIYDINKEYYLNDQKEMELLRCGCYEEEKMQYPKYLTHEIVNNRYYLEHKLDFIQRAGFGKTREWSLCLFRTMLCYLPSNKKGKLENQLMFQMIALHIKQVAMTEFTLSLNGNDTENVFLIIKFLLNSGIQRISVDLSVFDLNRETLFINSEKLEKGISIILNNPKVFFIKQSNDQFLDYVFFQLMYEDVGRVFKALNKEQFTDYFKRRKSVLEDNQYLMRQFLNYQYNIRA